MSTPTVLVTGASGFIGRYVCARLESAGMTVRRVVRKAGAVEDVVVPDLGPHPNWERALADIRTVIHLGAVAHRKDVPAAEYQRVNVDGTMAVAAAAVRAGVDRLVFMSTIGVVGATSSEPVTELTPTDPPTDYARSKLEAEIRLGEVAGLDVVILRPPLVLGPDAPGNVARLLRLVGRGVPLPLGGMRGRRSFIFVDNLADVTVACVSSQAASGELFVVSDGMDLSSAELVRRLAELSGRRSRVVTVPTSVLRGIAGLVGRADELVRLSEPLLVDASKVRSHLDWAPPVSVAEGLRQTASGIGA